MVEISVALLPAYVGSSKLKGKFYVKQCRVQVEQFKLVTFNQLYNLLDQMELNVLATLQIHVNPVITPQIHLGSYSCNKHLFPANAENAMRMIFQPCPAMVTASCPTEWSTLIGRDPMRYCALIGSDISVATISSAIQTQLKAPKISCLSLCLYGIRICLFRTRKGSIIEQP